MPDMKTISKKDLDKLRGKGWELTPDSRKAIRDQNRAAMRSKQVEAITRLSESVDGIKDALRANTGKDYTLIINRLIKSISDIKIEAPPTPEQKGYRFIVKRGGDGLITEIEVHAK